MHLLAHYKTNTQIQKQATAFRQGILEVLEKSWLSSFDPYELNVLISGEYLYFFLRLPFFNAPSKIIMKISCINSEYRVKYTRVKETFNFFLIQFSHTCILGSVDLRFDDLKKCCTYAGGYNEQSPVVTWLWEILLFESTVEEQ